MKNKYLKHLMTSAAIATCGIFSGNAFGQTMEDALVAAYLNNPTLRAEQASLRASDEEVSQALSNWRPTIELTGDTGFEKNASSLRTGSDRSQNRRPSSIALELSQPLFRGGRTMAEISEAENTVMAARATLTSVEQDTLLDAAIAYLDIVRDAAVLELNTNNEAVHKRQLEATQDRFQVGEITRTDVHQSEARLARSTADRVQSHSTLEAARSAYMNVTGEAAGATMALPPLPPGAPESKEIAITEAVLSNPNVISAQYDERAAIDNVDAIWGLMLPEVDLTASTGRDWNSSGISTRVDSTEAIVSVTIPLYQSGSVYSRLRAAKQQVAEQRLIVDQQRRNVTEQASLAWENLQSAQAQVSSFRTAIQAAKVAFDGVEREASVGSRTVLDVLDAEQELLDARVSFTRAKHDEAVAVFQLLASMGRLTAHYLQLPVDFYDPTQHYDEVRDMWMGEDSSGQWE
jgi:outer membrane protein